MKVTTAVGELQSHRRIMERVKRALAEQDFSLIVLFPTLSLRNAIQDELLKQPDVAGIGGVRFLLLEGFVEEIGDRFGLNQRHPTELEQQLLIAGAYQGLAQAGELDHLNQAPFAAGYREAILAGIAEWKRAGLTPEIFSDWATDQNLKIRQLALLYQTYQELLREKSFVEDDLILEELQTIQTGDPGLVQRTPVLLYGFTDLTPLQADFIQTLDRWFDFEVLVDPTAVPELQRLTARYFPIKITPVSGTAAPQSALAKLQTYFWRRTAEPLPGAPDDPSVQLIQAAGWPKQVRAIARAIRYAMEQNGYRVEDFLIVTPQVQQFLKAAKPVFTEYGLPLAGPNFAARELPGVSHFIQTLTALTNDWQWLDLEILIRQWHAGSVTDGDRLVVQLRETYGAVCGREQWLKLPDDPELREWAAGNGVRLERFGQGIETLAGYPLEASLLQFLEMTRIWFNHSDAWEWQPFDGDAVVLGQQLRNYQAMGAIGLTIDQILGYLPGAAEQRLTLSQYQRFFEDYFLALEVSEPRAVRPQFRVLPPREARGLRAKAVFIANLEQGSLPRVYINDWKLSPAERRELKTLGMELETGEQYQLQEKLAFYWALQAPSEQLYLVYRDQDDEGQPLNRSLFLEEVLEWLPQLSERIRKYGLAPEIQPQFSQCRSQPEERLRWLEYLHTDRRAVPAAEGAICRGLLQQREYQRLLQTVRRWRNRGRPGGMFADRSLVRRFGPDYPFGITALEDYRSCPYRFYLKYLLKIKPLTQPGLVPENLDLGNLYHDVFRNFLRRYRTKPLRPENFDADLAVLEAEFTAGFSVWQTKAVNDLARAVLLIQREQARRVLRQWLTAEVQWAERTEYRFRPCQFELAFGLRPAITAGDDPVDPPTGPFRLEWPEGNATITGRIDRVDVDPAGRFVVYDYKLGSGPSASDLVNLKKIQIPVYLLALEQLIYGADAAVGGSYLGLRNPSRTKGGIWQQERLGMSWKGKGLLEPADWDEWLDQVRAELGTVIDAIRKGMFPLTAEKCPSYCEYKASCRRREWEGGSGDGASAQ